MVFFQQSDVYLFHEIWSGCGYLDRWVGAVDMEVEAYARPAPHLRLQLVCLRAAAQVAGQKETRTDLGAARGAQGSRR